jgi:hypothetical protein
MIDESVLLLTTRTCLPLPDLEGFAVFVVGR